MTEFRNLKTMYFDQAADDDHQREIVAAGGEPIPRRIAEINILAIGSDKCYTAVENARLISHVLLCIGKYPLPKLHFIPLDPSNSSFNAVYAEEVDSSSSPCFGDWCRYRVDLQSAIEDYRLPGDYKSWQVYTYWEGWDYTVTVRSEEGD